MYGVHAGLEAGVSSEFGTSPDLGTFTGFSDGLSGGAGIITGSISWSESSGEKSLAGGVGAGLPNTLDYGGSGYFSETDVTSFSCPKKG
jgi:hypothetical protein